MNQDYILKMVGISKSFPGVKALDNVDMELREGEVLALLGENGAGKSTLLKILSGVYKADSGYIELDGVRQNYKRPVDASDAGISIIYQELNYIVDLSVGENIMLGRLPMKKGNILVDWKKTYEESKRVLDFMKVDIDPRRTMGSLSTAERQLVEIAKALSRDTRILVMDEPTSALNEKETARLLQLVREIAHTGKSVIYISHRMEELFSVSDRVMIMRDGCRVGVKNTADTNQEELIKLMVGRDINELYPKKDIPKGDVIFEIRHFTNAKLKDVALNVRAGEIVGLFGLMGSGRTNLARSIFGADKKDSGEVYLNGQKVEIRSPQQALQNGIAYLPSERKTEGLILMQSVQDNMMLASLPKFSKGIRMDDRGSRQIAQRWAKELEIRTPSVETEVGTLSGGNQQKVVLAKWLETSPKVIILNEPTRGIDVGAKREIYNLMEMLCEKGMAVIMISSELPEILGLADRVVVISDGRITGEMDREDATMEKIMSLAI